MLTTVPVTSKIQDQAGNPIVGAILTARLSALEVDGGFVVPAEVTATSDAAGDVTLNLWPNSLGTKSTSYRIFATSAGRIVFDYTAVVPPNPCNLQDIVYATPYPAVSAPDQALAALNEASYNTIASITASRVAAEAAITAIAAANTSAIAGGTASILATKTAAELAVNTTASTAQAAIDATKTAAETSVNNTASTAVASINTAVTNNNATMSGYVDAAATQAAAAEASVVDFDFNLLHIATALVNTQAIIATYHPIA